MKTYITFGYGHAHAIDGKTFDKDCVAVLESESATEGRAKAFEYFGDKFCFEYPEDQWHEDHQLPYFPRGYIEL